MTQVEWDPRMPVESRDEATGRGRFSTSSSSALNVMARMIDALDLRPGARVLEIGTGTGYNAAVLAHIVGEGNVTSVEVDAELADRARQALEGYGVEVVVGDGRHGHRDGAPYDRLISTAAVSELPSAWEEQVRPDGIIVAPWADGTLGIITVGEGARVEPDAPFMMMRP
ncbi:methyltransferase domain-containing protein [Spiractinospora alimapuensis]|nr:methyltransferase domain-containing protein [Spiractinospora alimapuensis]